jgi:hypothetical protein
MKCIKGNTEKAPKCHSRGVCARTTLSEDNNPGFSKEAGFQQKLASNALVGGGENTYLVFP